MHTTTLLDLNHRIAKRKYLSHSESLNTRTIAENNDSRLTVLSPLAYLADLLDYASKHLRTESSFLSLEDLENNFHQPFSHIPLNNKSQDEKVAQIRMCIEVLRKYTQGKEQSQHRIQTELRYRSEAYETILLELGISYEELQQLDNATAEEREQLARQVGISTTHLPELWSEEAPPEESWLAEVFGLPDTNEISFLYEDPLMLQWQKALITAKAGEVFEEDDVEAKEAWIAEHHQTAQLRLQKAIQKTEEVCLPILRTAFLPSMDHARQMSNRLMINCEYDASFRTTRVSQAITTIQQVIAAVRSGLLRDTHPDWRLVTTSFEEEWKWLGTYENWRAAMTVFLFPENVLEPTINRARSPVLEAIMHELRKNRRLNEHGAKSALNQYEAYFQDICQLKVDANCTTAYSDDIDTAITFHFGRARNSGRMYMASFDGEVQSHWEEIPFLTKYPIKKIIAAVPLKKKKRAIYLFVCYSSVASSEEYTASAGTSSGMGPLLGQADAEPSSAVYEKLHVLKYDLLTKVWENGFKIPLPSSTNQAICIEKIGNESLSPRIYVKAATGQKLLYANFINKDDSGLTNDPWYATIFSEDTELLGAAQVNYQPLVFTTTGGNGVDGKADVWNFNKKIDARLPKRKILTGDLLGLVMLGSDQVHCLLNRTSSPRFTKVDSFTVNSFDDPIPADPNTHTIFDIGYPLTYLAEHQGATVERPGVQSGSVIPEKEGIRLTLELEEDGTKLNKHVFFYLDNSEFKHSRPVKLLHTGVTLTDLDYTFSEARKTAIRAAFEANKGEPSGNVWEPDYSEFLLRYFWEAYYFLPLYIGKQLTRSGQYTFAKDYFKLVYDYSLPSEKAKVFYGLIEEEGFTSHYFRNWNWLQDPLNPHFIAGTRQNAYSQYTLLTIIQCLLKEADAAFTLDTVESLEKARNLYLTGLNLLKQLSVQNGGANQEANRSIKVSNEVLGELLRARKAMLRSISVEEKSNALISRNTQTSSFVEGALITINTFDFSIPENPVWQFLTLHAENNLVKLNTGRNFSGEERPVPQFSLQEPKIDYLNGDILGQLLPQTVTLPPTTFRYTVLIERAKQLASMAQQMESAFLSTLEKLDAEQLGLLNAKKDLQISKANIRLQDLRLREANSNLKLAELQTERAQIQKNHYNEMLRKGPSGWEVAAMAAELYAKAAHSADSWKFWKAGETAGRAAEAFARFAQMKASLERKRQDWRFQRKLAEKDISIGLQQERTAKDRRNIVGQERNIASLRSEHAEEVANFLTNKFTNAELYDWMSDVLEEVYSFFLRNATVTAQLAAQQLAFERQEPVPAIILADYWEPTNSDGQTFLEADNNQPQDRRGLTGAARLMQDIYQLDQYHLQTDQRKLQLTKTISLANLSPVEFQQFRETGSILFQTPMEIFDRDFPGHYLRLIKRLRVSVIALVPAAEGIHATLWNSGISRTVQQTGESFISTEVQRLPEVIALTGALNDDGVFDFEASDRSKRMPFESMGVDTSWELQLSKRTNLSLDYNSIADVLITIDYTALHNEQYRLQVIEQMDETLSSDRAYSFRLDFPDQWYDLHHPELLAEDTQLTVHFEIFEEDFPPNFSEITTKHIALYLPQDNPTDLAITLNREGKAYPHQARMTPNGIVSSRQVENSPQRWISMLNTSPVGTWTLSFPNNDHVKQWFKEGRFEDILLVITYEGKVP